ncbi:MAG: YlxR family protein [Bacilli bacterium]|nr:YlxR family protein [Bacilli bacterium]
MKVKKIPERTCVVTREKFPKGELLRIVRTPEGAVEIDLAGKKNGRGAYIKKDLDVLAKAKKNKTLEHHLEVTIDESIYEEIKNVIKNS